MGSQVRETQEFLDCQAAVLNLKSLKELSRKQDGPTTTVVLKTARRIACGHRFTGSVCVDSIHLLSAETPQAPVSDV